MYLCRMRRCPCSSPQMVVTTATMSLLGLLVLILHTGLCFAADADYLHDHSADVASAEAGKAKLGSGYLKQVLHSSDGHQDYGGYGQGCQHYESHRYYEGYFYSNNRRVHYSCGATCRCERGTVRCTKEVCNYNHYNPYSHNSNSGRWTWSSRYNPFNKPFFSSYGSGYQYNFNPHFGGGGHSGFGPSHHDSFPNHGTMGDHGSYGDMPGGFPDHSGYGDHHGGYGGDHGGYHGPGSYSGSGGYGGDGGSYTGGGGGGSHYYPGSHTGPGGYGSHGSYSSTRGGTGYGSKSAHPVRSGSSGHSGNSGSGSGHHSTGRVSSTYQQHPNPYDRRSSYNFGYDGGRGKASGHRTEYNNGYRKQKTYRDPNNRSYRKTSQYSQQSGKSFSTNQEYATQH